MFRYSEFTIAEYFRKQGAVIGENCYISLLDLGSEPYLITIGNHVLIGRGVLFHTHEGGTWIYKEEIPDMEIYGRIVIEDNCLIGANAHLFSNITIGKNSIIGAGSVVISDVPPNSVVMGSPARVIGSSLKLREKYIANWNEQKLLNYKRLARGRFGRKSIYSKNEQELRLHLEKILDGLERLNVSS